MLRTEILKLLTILFGILCSGSGQEDRILLKVSTAQALELRQCAETCGKEYGVDPKDLRKILTWTMPDDKPHKQFLYCIFFTSGYIEEDGHFKVEETLRFLPINGTRDDAKQIYEDCNKITKENNFDTMHEMDACFHRHFVPIVETAKAS